jgi:hypothetical protein
MAEGVAEWHTRLDGEWQWQGGSGISRQRTSARFEWWWFESGSGSIGRVAMD